MGYTRHKIRRINLSFQLAGLTFVGWAAVRAWQGWPRGIRGGGITGLCIFAIPAIFFSAFPVIWARYPKKHPVNHELRRYGTLREMSTRLDAEMSGPVESLGPFRFTATLLVYDSGQEFRMVPYDQIASAETTRDEGTDEIIVVTQTGRRYQWFSTWMQGFFNPEEVLSRIRTAANLDDPDSSVPSESPVV